MTDDRPSADRLPTGTPAPGQPLTVNAAAQRPAADPDRSDRSAATGQPGHAQPRHAEPAPSLADHDDRSNWDRMLAGDLYVADDPRMERLNRTATARLAAYRRAWEEEDPGAQAILAEVIGGLGDDVVVRPPISVDYGRFISIGPRTFVNYNLLALDVARITIGADCMIGPNVQLLTPTHPVDPEPRRAKLEAAEPITLGDNVWLGGGVTVCPGVTIGDNTVVGAGSVVTRDLPANVVAVGNPARVPMTNYLTSTFGPSRATRQHAARSPVRRRPRPPRPSAPARSPW